jgi:aspartyl-tRNA(Asn)/glutamyl-tRNA(Gln) amidotransferase subunit A
VTVAPTDAIAGELGFLPARALAERIRTGALSAVALCEATLSRIDALDGRLGAYLHVDRAGARRQAEAIDAARAAGAALGPLAGVPIALKDVLVTRGVPTTAGSRMLAGWIPPYDAACVERLAAAGAVLIGKTSCDEFAMGSSNEHCAAGPCGNPWDLERVPGGSSGGSAAAVAAGLCAAALGTDTGGSIRQPAALCGVTGLKPTYGRVSRWGVVAFASSLDQVGPIARSVDDAALLLEVIGGHDRRDATSIDAPAPALGEALGRGVAGLRIGLPKEWQASGIDPEVGAAVEAALGALSAAGASVVPVSLPHLPHALAVYYLIAPAEASSNLARFDGVRYGHRAALPPGASLLEMYKQSRRGFGPEVQRRIMLGTYALRAGYYDAYYRKAQQVRELIRRDFERAFAEVDLVASPTSPTAAFRRGEKQTPLDMYLADVFTLACNLAGLPGLSVPCGATAGGLPIGLQLLAAPLREDTLCAAGAAYQAVTDWHLRRPPDFAAAEVAP